MPKPNKIKVIRKVSNTQLYPSIDNAVLQSTLNSYAGGVGIASTTRESAGCFSLIGRSNMRDNIGGSVAISGNPSADGHAGNGRHDNGENHQESHYTGGTGDGGGNFIYADVSTLTSPWCICVSAAATSGKFVRSSSISDEYMLTTSPVSGVPAYVQNHGGPTHHHVYGRTNAPGNLAPLNCTYTTPSPIFNNVCCVSGCLNASGGYSGYYQSSFCTNNLVPSNYTNCSQSRCYCSGWVHIRTSGRNSNE